MKGRIMNVKPPTKQFHYGWVVLAVSFLMVGCAQGFGSSPGSLYLSAVTEDLGIHRSVYSIANSCRYITVAGVNLFFGKLIAKLGTRKMAAMGFVCMAASAALNSVAQNVVIFYVGGVLLGLGLAWTGTSLVGVVVEQWFTSKKGTIMGIILASNGVMGALAVQLLTPVIFGATDGWRNSYRIVCILMLCVGVLVALLLRGSPKDLGLTPLGSGQTAAKKSRGSQWTGISQRQALRKPYFYVCAVCVFLTGMLLTAVNGVASAHMLDRGIPKETMSLALSIHAIALTVAKMYTGFSFDKFGLRITMLVCNLCAVVGILLLAFVSNGAMAIVAETLTSFALPLETIMLPLITAELFGRKDYAQIMGLLIAFNQMGYAVGMPLTNLVYDLTGTYTNVMVIMCGIMVAAAITMQLVITAAKQEQKKTA